MLLERSDGRFLALRLDWIADMGAYVTPAGPVSHIRNPSTCLTGVYAICRREAITVTNVFQDERTDHTGDGKTCPDAAGAGSASVGLRSERSGQLDGRVYRVFFQAEDGRGGRCEGEVTVCVPHDNKSACVDQGALYDSTVCE